jgi:Protein of unknown function (DUF1593).
MTKQALLLFAILCTVTLAAQQPVPVKPRILISTDIGGTDPDDNQSMAHLLMYSDRFHIEGLVSSPSYGNGSKQEILRMIGLYEKDLPQLRKHQKGLASPTYMRSITRQGHRGNAPYIGYAEASEGSNHIIRCARKKSTQPLWILGWGGLEDLAQALHDAPDIQDKIRVYWIGGPNKKWSANSYAYIVANFPNLRFIEVNSSYYGFFSNSDAPDSIRSTNYYSHCIEARGALGKDFINYYKGEVKMGDTPSLLYMMDGSPSDPTRESWGGSFEKFTYSPRVIFNRTTTVADTVAFCTVMEFHFRGPEINALPDSVCFHMETFYKNNVQRWPGYYLGKGEYVLRYIPKQAEVLNYRFTSNIAGFAPGEGQIVVTNGWPGKPHATDYKLGPNWFTDKADPSLYDGKLQGGKTINKWRSDILSDWAKRWKWLEK